MLVYRICAKEEIDLIFAKGIEFAGSYRKKIYVNTHNYQSNVKYLHFFFNKIDILHINDNRGYFICTYDIPQKLLDLYYGAGLYNAFRHKNEPYVIEFAIPSSELKFEYLKRVDKLLRYIRYEDFLDGELPKEFYETIYDSSSPLIRKRKKEEKPS